MCGETSTGFTTNGEAWTVSLSIAKCIADGLTFYDVVITAEDSAGESFLVGIQIPDPYDSDNNNQDITDDGSDKEESGLPSIGIFATVISMLGAALLLRRD